MDYLPVSRDLVDARVKSGRAAITRRERHDVATLVHETKHVVGIIKE